MPEVDVSIRGKELKLPYDVPDAPNAGKEREAELLGFIPIMQQYIRAQFKLQILQLPTAVRPRYSNFSRHSTLALAQSHRILLASNLQPCKASHGQKSNKPQNIGPC